MWKLSLAALGTLRANKLREEGFISPSFDTEIIQATLRRVVEELREYQITTQKPGVMFYIPIKDWVELKLEAGV